MCFREERQGPCGICRLSCFAAEDVHEGDELLFEFEGVSL